MLTLIPADLGKEMKATVEYRLINEMQQRFIYETLGIMAVGVALILIFGIVLYKALSSSIQSEIALQQERAQVR